MSQGIIQQNKMALIMLTKTLLVKQTIASKHGASATINIKEPGYSPLGIVGVTNSGGGGLSISDFYFDTNDTVTLYYYNNRSDSKYLISISVVILYVRDDQKQVI